MKTLQWVLFTVALLSAPHWILSAPSPLADPRSNQALYQESQVALPADVEQNDMTHPPEHGTHPPEHGTHPPEHGTHPPEHGTHPPEHGTHPPEHGTHPPEHGTHPPEHGTHPPEHGTHPPEHGTHPPEHGTHPPGHGTHPPGHGTHPPGHGTHPPGHGTHPPGHGGGGHSMPMWFHVTNHATILFEKWHTMVWQELLGSCIGIAVFAILFEGLKVLRDWLQVKRFKRALRQSPKVTAANGYPMTEKNESSFNLAGATPTYKLSPFDGYHLLQTLLHLVQIFVGYCLMLVVMTYNAYLVLAVCLGCTIGYFIFSWNKFPVQDVNDCCN